MKHRPYLILSAFVFAVVGIAHLVRALYQVPIQAGEWEFPVGLSWGGGVVAIGLCVWGLSLARK